MSVASTAGRHRRPPTYPSGRVGPRSPLTEEIKPLYHGKVRHVKPKGFAGDVAIYTGTGPLGRVADRKGTLPAPGVRSQLRRVR
jgi:hypothetical protein